MNAKTAELIDRLLEKTENRKLQWEKTSRSDQYVLSLSENQITIEYNGPSNPFTAEYEFSVLDIIGNEIECVEASKDTDTFDRLALKNLYNAAHRNALHIDETIDKLLNELK